VFWTIICCTLPGCGKTPRGDSSAQALSHDQDAKAEIATGEAQPMTPYVNCRGTLTAMEKEHAWFDDSAVGIDHGTAPLASFVLSEPAAHAERTISILFK
jgi:hypothetical protein